MPEVRFVTATISGGIIVYYLWHAPGSADALDRVVLVAFLLYAAAGTLSQFPRQSLDALLGGLTYTGGFFLARRQLRSEPVRRAFHGVLLGLSITLTITTAARWLPVLQVWWSGTGSLLPAFDLDYPSVPWGHWHDLALLVAMLYPAWWMGRSSPLRRTGAIIFGLLVAAIVFVDGSRNLWAAVVLATGFTALASGLWRVRGVRYAALVSAGFASLAIVLGIAAGAAGPLLERATNLTNLGSRTAMWKAIIDGWLSHPLAGYGPGSFPWILQQTNYFVTNSYAPRHPDDVAFQLIGEVGLLGVAAGLVLLIALLPRVLNARSRAATWALIAYAAAGLLANPTDFGFLNAVAIGWAGFAMPHVDRAAELKATAPTISPVRMATAGGLVVIAAAYGATVLASFSYERAADAIAHNHLPEARSFMDSAVALDPGLALYTLQRGTLGYVMNDRKAAISDLDAASSMNPSDDLAWRILALARRAAGDLRGSEAALRQALGAHRSDTTNLLLQARWETEDGNAQDALSTLGEVVQAWPSVVAAPRWQELLPPSVTTEDVLHEAISRWRRGDSSPEPFTGQAIWLSVLGNRPDLIPDAVGDAGISVPLTDVGIAVFRCEPSNQQLSSMSAGDRRTLYYWLLRVRASATFGQPDLAAINVVQAWGGGPITLTTSEEVLNPLNENDQSGFSADVWGYRRPPIRWPPGASQLPSVSAGSVRWLLDPRGAARDADVLAVLPACR